MAKIPRRLMAGLALAGVVYALDPKRDLLRRARDPEERRRWREQLDARLRDWRQQTGTWRDELRPRMERFEQEYGPTLRRVAAAAGFMPGMRFRWRVLAALAPQIANALNRAGSRDATRRAAQAVRADHQAEAPTPRPATSPIDPAPI